MTDGRRPGGQKSEEERGDNLASCRRYDSVTMAVMARLGDRRLPAMPIQGGAPWLFLLSDCQGESRIGEAAEKPRTAHLADVAGGRKTALIVIASAGSQRATLTRA